MKKSAMGKLRKDKSDNQMMGILVLLAVTLFLGLVAISFKLRVLVWQKMVSEAASRPKAVQLFACGDNCPGARERYMKWVYEGVKDEQSCVKYGGVWSYYVGWGKTYYCGVK